MADLLDEAVAQGAVTADVLAQHSKWCHTGGSWSGGIGPAREAAEAMYGRVPARLLDNENRPLPDHDTLIADPRRRIEET